MSVVPAALRDPRNDARLRRDGFVRIPLLDRPRVAALRAEFLRLRGDVGGGFVPDLLIDDREYRDSASEFLADALDEVATGLFTGYRPFLRNYLCKYPGDGSELYLHQDWMYVDERSGARTYVVWVALEDIDGDNGQLQVLRGSHRLERMLRGTSLVAPWLRHEEVIRDRLLTVPVRAGEALVFDNALVHCSLPNRTDRPRVAAAVALRPLGEHLVHFRGSGSGEAVRYDVDEQFFRHVHPPRLMSSPPDLGVAEVIRIDEDDHALAPDALARFLDRPPLARLDRVARWSRDRRRRSTAA